VISFGYSEPQKLRICITTYMVPPISFSLFWFFFFS
jgi:hypothetical protein